MSDSEHGPAPEQQGGEEQSPFQTILDMASAERRQLRKERDLYREQAKLTEEFWKRVWAACWLQCQQLLQDNQRLKEQSHG